VSAVEATRAAPAGDPVAQTRNPAVEIFLWSRAAIWVAALFSYLWFEPKPPPLQRLWDDRFLHDLGWATDVWARWDSRWFLQIAEHGYSSDPDSTPAFFPLYPSLVAGLGRMLAGHFLLAGVLVALGCALGAFVLLYRLAEEKLGADGARRSVLYLAVFPMSLFLQAVYSESLFLLLAVAAFVLAERGRWRAAAGATALALLARPQGFALLPALALLGHRRRERGAWWVAASPLAFLAYPLLLWQQVGDPLAFLDAQGTWRRELSWAGPLAGVWDGARGAWAGIRQIVAGPDGRIYWEIENAEPLHAAAVNVSAFAFLVLFVALTVIAWRRLGAPYGLFCASSLALPLSVPSERWPLLSLPRFGLVIFPFFLALAVLGRRQRVHGAIVAVSAAFLGVAIVQWTMWQWVA
jgi:hypothetical protein